ncbi:MAG TPA: hypothetical protein VKP30_15490 [Polyangiaceae bacterium]|nr:hypothetical protein [Polyangiaceae bacterium]
MCLRPWFQTLLTLALLASVTACADEKPAAQCVPFETCGGDVSGTWSISGSCVEGNLRAAANLRPELPVACQGMYKDVSGVMSGSVTFVAGTATVDTTLALASEIKLDAGCATALGVAQLDSASCEGFGATLAAQQLHGGAECEFLDGRCRCLAHDVRTETGTRSYQVANSRITYSGSADYLDFCVKDDTMRARQFNRQLVATIFIDAKKQ